MLPQKQGALRRHFGGMPATFWWLWTGAFLSALATFVFPFLALFLTSRGFSPARVGVLLALYGVGNIFSGPLAGISSDWIGRRPTILAALLGSASTAATLAFLSSPVALGFVVLLFGLASTSIYAPIHATVADVIPADRRPHALGLLYWANNIGIGVSLVIGGMLASRGWALPFLADATTTLVFALLVWHRLPETRPAPEVGATDSSIGYGIVLGDRRFVAFLGLQILFGLAFWQMTTALPIHMARRGFSAATYGRVLAVDTAMIALLQPFAGRVTGRHRPTVVLTAASLVIGVGFGAYVMCTSAWHYALATAIWSLGEIAYMPVSAALVAQMAPAQFRGRYSGAYGVTFGIGGFLAPLVGPSAMQAFGSQVLWIGCFAVGLIASIGYLALGRALHQEAHPQPRV